MKLLYLYILLIFSLSLIPSMNINSMQIYGLDKLAHLLEYFILGVIFKYSIDKIMKPHYCLILCVPLIDEFVIQRFSGRNVDIYDFIFDISGLASGIIIKFIIEKRNPVKD